MQNHDNHTNHVICPLCSEGEFREYGDGNFTFSHGKKKYVVEGQLYARCSVCKVEGFLPGQRALNEISIANFQKDIPDYVSPSDVLAVRERYALTQNQASQIFKGGVNGFSKWERGITYPSGATAMLIKAALASAEAMQTFAEIARVGFSVVDQKPLAAPASVNEESMKPLVFTATHVEYYDDARVVGCDNETDNEDRTSWTTLNTRSTKARPFHN